MGVPEELRTCWSECLECEKYGGWKYQTLRLCAQWCKILKNNKKDSSNGIAYSDDCTSFLNTINYDFATKKSLSNNNNNNHKISTVAQIKSKVTTTTPVPPPPVPPPPISSTTSTSSTSSITTKTSPTTIPTVETELDDEFNSTLQMDNSTLSYNETTEWDNLLYNETYSDYDNDTNNTNDTNFYFNNQMVNLTETTKKIMLIDLKKKVTTKERKKIILPLSLPTLKAEKKEIRRKVDHQLQWFF